MKIKCPRCNKEYEPSPLRGICWDCKEKEDRVAMYMVIGLVAAFFLIVGGLRLGWAELVYHDWRCALSECRIIKD